MKNSKSVDVLADPEIRRHTERILALREEERQTREQLRGRGTANLFPNLGNVF